MPPHVAFLRAVNLPRRSTPMADVRRILTDAGFAGVQTYIQSGNVLVEGGARESAEVASVASEVLGRHFGFEVPVIVRRPPALVEILAEVAAAPDPYPEGRSYLAFLDRPLGDAARASIDGWDVPQEWARVLSGGDTVLYRLGVSAHEAKLTNARLEKGGVVSTSRGVRVVTEIARRWGTIS